MRGECKFVVWLFSMWQSGHLNPTLLLGTALARSRLDVCVRIVGAEEQEHRFPPRDAPLGKIAFQPGYTLPPEFATEEQERKFWEKVIDIYETPKGMDMFANQREQFFEHDFTVFGQMLDSASQKPDLVVVDFASTGIAEAVAHRGLKLALSTTAPISMGGLCGTLDPPSWLPVPSRLDFPEASKMSFRDRLANVYARYAARSDNDRRAAGVDRMRAKYGLPPRPRGAVADFVPGEPLILASAFFPLEPPRALPPNVVLVGPYAATTAVDPALASSAQSLFDQLRTNTSNPFVYVAMGSVASVSAEQVKGVIATAAAMPDVNFLWSLRPGAGKQHLSDLGLQIPGNVVVSEWAPQTAILQRRPPPLAFVSHCGGSSSGESLAAGVPLLCDGFGYDQPVIAKRIEQLGAGMVVKLKNATQLTAALRQVAESRSAFAEAAAVLGRAAARAGGSDRAAELLGELLEDRSDGRLLSFASEAKGLRWWQLEFETLLTVCVFGFMLVLSLSLAAYCWQ